MPARPSDAAAFHALHEDFLILPNAWDVASARVIAEAGAAAIATSSAALAWAQGYADGHHLPPANLAVAVAAIARVVNVPITADAEAGYSDDPATVGENISRLIGAGAVGINIEDGAAPHEAHVRKVEAAREAGERAGVRLFVNARTDVYLKALVPPEAALKEVLRRARALREAGASGLFTPRAALGDIAAIAEGAGLPLNIMAMPGMPDAAGLKALGVRRLSAATSTFNAAYAALRDAADEFLARGESEALWARRGQPLDFNALFRP